MDLEARYLLPSMTPAQLWAALVKRVSAHDARAIRHELKQRKKAAGQWKGFGLPNPNHVRTKWRYEPNVDQLCERISPGSVLVALPLVGGIVDASSGKIPIKPTPP